jgi:hypothetical protein
MKKEYNELMMRFLYAGENNDVLTSSLEQDNDNDGYTDDFID